MNSKLKASIACALSIVAIFAVLTIENHAVVRQDTSQQAGVFLHTNKLCSSDCSCTYMHPQPNDNAKDKLVAERTLVACKESQATYKVFCQQNTDLCHDVQVIGKTAKGPTLGKLTKNAADDGDGDGFKIGNDGGAPKKEELTQYGHNCLALKAFSNVIADSSEDEDLHFRFLQVLAPVISGLAASTEAAESQFECMTKLDDIFATMDAEEFKPDSLPMTMLKQIKKNMKDGHGILVQKSLDTTGAGCKSYGAVECARHAESRASGQYVMVGSNLVGYAGGNIFQALSISSSQLQLEAKRMQTSIAPPKSDVKPIFGNKAAEVLKKWPGNE